MPEQIAQPVSELWLIGIMFDDPNDCHFDRNMKAVDDFLRQMVFCEERDSHSIGDLELFTFPSHIGATEGKGSPVTWEKKGEVAEVVRGPQRAAFGIVVNNEQVGRKYLANVRHLFQILNISEPSVWRLPVQTA